MRGLDGKVAIVTGGASGLGRAIARRMASEGARVAVADINDDGAARVVAEITDQGGSARAISVDVSDDAAVQRMVASAVDAFGRIDALFNNAAALGNETVGHDGDLSELDVDTWDRTLAINLRGVMLGCKYTVPHLVAAGGGAIVNIASTGAFQGTVVRSAYGASKAGVIGFSRYVAAMYAADRVRCNAVAPAYMANPDTLDERHPISAAWRATSACSPIRPPRTTSPPWPSSWPPTTPAPSPARRTWSTPDASPVGRPTASGPPSATSPTELGR